MLVMNAMKCYEMLLNFIKRLFALYFKILWLFVQVLVQR